MEARQRSARKVLAVASGGGHWVQLRRLSDAFEGHEVTWVAADPALASEVGDAPFRAVQDASREEPLLMVRTVVDTIRIVLAVRPDVVITTGAAPGVLALLWGRLIGARTLWIDSVANAEELSLSGRLALRFAHEVLTQWPHLAEGRRPGFEGAVL